MHATLSETRQREKLDVTIHSTAAEASISLAREIASLIRNRAAEGKRLVLGLATGSTPVPVYRELIRMHREEGLSFANVFTFNLDEYYGIAREHPESYWSFMHQQLFNHIDLPAEQLHIPNGTLPRAEVFAACHAYEERIAELGGLDLQVLGIGRTGHIGFNEPGSGRNSRTRLVTLDALTRRDAERDFPGEDKVPRHAITMGVGTIMQARRIVMLAWGEAKARVVAQAVEGEPRESLPASFLQHHPNVTVMLDSAAAAELTRIKLPWLVGPVEWTPPMAHRAVTWLAANVQRPLLKLLDEHYAEHGMADLLTAQGPAYQLNIQHFNDVQHTITGWPGGKAGADDTHRPEKATPYPKRVLVIAPEPSDEMLGMGGTLTRLVEQGHILTVAYLTSGSLAVPDEEAEMAAELINAYAKERGAGIAGDVATAPQTGIAACGAATDAPAAASATAQAAATATATGPATSASTSADTRRLKAVIRRGEARQALRCAGVSPAAARFLDLPFYERGRYRQFFPGEDDVAALSQLIGEVAPHQIFSTGAGQEPNSVGGICHALLMAALRRARTAGTLPQGARLWLYRTPDKAWQPHEINMAVPLSPAQLARRTRAIYQHKSQLSQTPPPQSTLCEAWQVAEASSRNIAVTYDALGLAEYEAIEAFQRVDVAGE
ncbi:glucosamine-6-phosphate deaminase [Verrucomicrobia bacterium LW23]|nr:glucosamine-6-phosphate deaminase [Verrucomicrobia bacterium LW23]